MSCFQFVETRTFGVDGDLATAALRRSVLDFARVQYARLRDADRLWCITVAGRSNEQAERDCRAKINWRRLWFFWNRRHASATAATTHSFVEFSECEAKRPFRRWTLSRPSLKAEGFALSFSPSLLIFTRETVPLFSRLTHRCFAPSRTTNQGFQRLGPRVSAVGSEGFSGWVSAARTTLHGLDMDSWGEYWFLCLGETSWQRDEARKIVCSQRTLEISCPDQCTCM